MTKGGALMLLFVLLGIGGAAAAGGSSGSSTPAPPRPKPPRPSGPGSNPDPEPTEPEPYWVGPGWFWYFLDWKKDGPEYTALQARERNNMMVRKVIGHGSGFDVIIFEVAVEPMAWTLPGWPTPAPKGIDTTITDLESGPDPEATTDWAEFLEGLATQTVEQAQSYDARLQRWLNEQRDQINQWFGGGS